MDNMHAIVDWNAFNYIFSLNPQDAFQKLAEQIFCFEFHQIYGIYRYYNQPYIETMPIQYGEFCIGFQAKYYDASTNLSGRKKELMDSISGAHNRYPELNKIVFYINKEPGLSTNMANRNPAYIEEIENRGASLGIEIEWRGLNQIETMLLQPELQTIRDYFFQVNGGIRSFLSQIEQHKRSVFDSISSEIIYEGKTIMVDREEIDFDRFFSAEERILLISGEGGTGKSGQLKKQLSTENGFPVWLFRASDFDCAGVSEFARKFGDCTWDCVLSAFDSAPRKLVIIDSAEKAFFIKQQDTLKDVINSLYRHGWKIVITIRSSYKLNFINILLNTSRVLEHPIQRLTGEELSIIANTYGFSIPTDRNLQDFLGNLFYLKLYTFTVGFSPNNIRNFLKSIWDRVICNVVEQKDSLNIRRGKMICTLVQSNAERGTDYYASNLEIDWDALTALSEDGIIQYDEVMDGYFITHDVYEEIVLQHIIERAYNNKQNSWDVFQMIGNSLIMRKAFREWLRNHLKIWNNEIRQFLSEALIDQNVEQVWKDEILIALLSEENTGYSHFLDDILKEHEYAFFSRAFHLLHTACNIVDDDILQKLLTSEERKTYNCYRFTKPTGYGWNYLIPFAYAQREGIPWTPIIVMLVVDVLYAWSIHTHEGKTTRASGLLALYFYRLLQTSEYRYYLSESKKERVYDAILHSAKEILPELTEIFDIIIENKNINHLEPYTDLCEHLLKDAFNTGTMCSVAPDLVIRLMKLFWLADNTKKGICYYDLSDYAQFGLSGNRFRYYPDSAFQTPMLPLLYAAPNKAIDFIIELFDVVTETYKNSELGKAECGEIEIILPNGEHTIQTASVRLWQMYRGTHTAPELLSSLLMAFERWLYMEIPNCSEEMVNSFCLKLISRSHSAAITAVVVSMVMAYPDKLFPTACVLLRIRGLISLEINRLVGEHNANFIRGVSPAHQQYDEERITSNSLPFRKKRLENIILEYQIKRGTLPEEDFQKRLNTLYQIIDELFQQEEDLEESEQFALYRMDLRKMKLAHGHGSGDGQQVLLVSDFPDNLKQIQQDHEEQNKEYERYMQLDLWGYARLKHDQEQYEKYPQFEENPMFALKEAQKLLSMQDMSVIYESTLIQTAAVMLIEFKTQLDKNTEGICREIIIHYLRRSIEKQERWVITDKEEAAISALPILIEHQDCCDFLDNPVVFLLILICDWGKQRNCAVKVFREILWNLDPTIARKILYLFITLKNEYDVSISKYENDMMLKFLVAHQVQIEFVLEQPDVEITDYSHLSETALQTLNLLFPKNDFRTQEIVLKTGELFWSKFFSNRHSNYDRDGFRDLKQEHDYLNWLSEYLLLASEQEQINVLSRLLPCLSVSDTTANFLCDIVLVQDRLMLSQSFWRLWGMFFEHIESICKDSEHAFRKIQEKEMRTYYGGELDEIITTYLLAFPWWKKGAQEWHTLNEESGMFFAKAASRLGYHPGTLYSIARVLNTIGYEYIRDGVRWLAEIISNNPHLRKCSLQTNTEYYIEEFAQRFIALYRSSLKRNPAQRRDLLEVLGFLVDRGSTCGYMLRESIC